MRKLPNIKLKEIDGYAKLLARGFDTVKETFNMNIPESLIERLEGQKKLAAEKFDGQEGGMVAFGGEVLKLSPYGTRSALYVLGNDDFTIFLRSPKMEWCVSVEYRAAGLWEYGLETLRKRVLDCLFLEMRPQAHRGSVYNISDARSWQRVSKIDYAFDFYSPNFTAEMTPAIMERLFCPSKTKKDVDGEVKFKAYGKGVELETLTIGKKNNLQVQIYNKGKEITDTNGKSWMYALWAREGYKLPSDGKAKDVWRLEIRFGSEFLKNRGILTLQDAYHLLPALITEAIFTRRLTDVNLGDSNRSRWPMNPLWVAAYKSLADGVLCMLPMGRQTTLSDSARAEKLKKSIAGNIRSLAVLTDGDLDEGTAERLTYECYEIMLSDPAGHKKTEKAINRYFFTKEAA